MRIIFLDIDGVLNHSATRFDASPSPGEPLPLPIAPECLACLNRLISETNAKIVISSSWRLFARWQDLDAALKRQGLIAKVIGSTPDLVNDATWISHWNTRWGVPFAYDRLSRGWEIREWLARFAQGICSCGHESDLHDGGVGACYYKECLSGALGCCCRQFDGTPLTGFVILDDVSDMDELRPWLVHTDSKSGLTDPDVERAKCLLGRSGDGISIACQLALETSM